MKKMSAVLAGLLVMASSTGFAQTFTCEIEDFGNSMVEPGQEFLADHLTAQVDLKKGTVELNSSNELYGKNPFTVLTSAPNSIAQKYHDGVLVFAGKNIHEKNQLYVFSFDTKTKQGGFEVFRKNSKDVSTAKCR